MKILITGAKGQLGQELENLIKGVEVVSTDLPDFDIVSSENDVRNYLSGLNLTHIINCAAYTAVDKAEGDSEKAFLINESGPYYLAKACNSLGITLIHISTDFVFDGKNSSPYAETAACHPISVYGKSKLAGEQKVANYADKYYIIRTSWLYGAYGNNFMKTILKLADSRETISVIDDQVGTPTNTLSLARFIHSIILAQPTHGIYHFSNEGTASWYDFATEIIYLSEKICKVLPIPTKDYPTPAQRPSYSIMDKQKARKFLDWDIPHWKESLKDTIVNLKQSKVKI